MSLWRMDSIKRSISSLSEEEGINKYLLGLLSTYLLYGLILSVSVK